MTAPRSPPAPASKRPALRTALSRLMREFRETLRDEVRLTVETADAVPDELAYLMGLFQR